MAWTCRTAALLIAGLAATPASANCDVSAAPSTARDVLVSLPAIAAAPPMPVGGREMFACPRVATPASCPMTARKLEFRLAPPAAPPAWAAVARPTATASLD